MKTIEERADDFVGSPFRIGEDTCDTFRRLAYTVGATEQRQIDIEKAIEWFKKYLAEIGYPDDWCRDSEVQESGEKRFRKAMEE